MSVTPGTKVAELKVKLYDAAQMTYKGAIAKSPVTLAKSTA